MRNSQSTVNWDSLGSAESELCFEWLSDGVFMGHGSFSVQVKIVESTAEVDLVVFDVLCSSLGSEL